jgi:hypothetical protein
VIRLGLAFAAILIVCDVISAAIARAVGISYDTFIVPALVILFFMGVYSGRVARAWSGLTAVVIAVAIETTLGWYVASLIGPGYVPGWTVPALIVMGAQAAMLAIVVGAIGVAVGVRVSGARA